MKIMRRICQWFTICTVIGSTLQVHADEVVVQQPPSLPGVYAGGNAMDCSAPDYPYEARAYQLEGQTIVEMLIGDQGKVLGKRVAVSSGWKILDEAALAAMGSCRFTPITRDGKVGAYWKKYAYQWNLDDFAPGKRASRPVLVPGSCENGDRLQLIEKSREVDGVILRFLTTDKGDVGGIKVERGSGRASIDKEAVKTLQSCKLMPSQLDGKPVYGAAVARYAIDTQ